MLACTSESRKFHWYTRGCTESFSATHLNFHAGGEVSQGCCTRFQMDDAVPVAINVQQVLQRLIGMLRAGCNHLDSTCQQQCSPEQQCPDVLHAWQFDFQPSYHEMGTRCAALRCLQAQQFCMKHCDSPVCVIVAAMETHAIAMAVAKTHAAM